MGTRKNDDLVGGTSVPKPRKKPMSDLHTLLVGEIEKVPLKMFGRMLQQKIADAGSTISDSGSEELAAHLLAGSAENFQWDDGTGRDGTLGVEVTDDDIQSLLEEVDAFQKNKLQGVIDGMVESSGKIILRSLQKDWPEQKAYDELRMESFRYNLEDRWGAAFDILRMMYTICMEMGNEVAKRWRRSRKPALREVLFRLHARACQVTAEIICLMANGYADGAMARWRTLHEITVVASIIAEHGNELAERYLAHEAVEAKRAMDRFMACHAALGYAPMTKREIRDVEKRYAACLQAYGDNFGSQYGWAAHHLGMKKPRFDDLEARAGHVAMRSHYQMASYNVHATTKGIAFRLGLLDGEGVTALAGASNAGFSEPAQNTAQSLTQITGLLFGENWRFDEMIEMRILISLRDRLPKALNRAERELARSHRDHQQHLRAKALRRKKRSRPANSPD